MKKYKYILIVFLFIVFTLFSIRVWNQLKNEKIKLSISADINKYSLTMSSTRGITLTPKIEGQISDNIKFHWVLKNNKTESFLTSNGNVNEVINNGESVLFQVGENIGFDESSELTNTIEVFLKIEDKFSKKVLGESKLLIEEYNGIYKIKDL